MYSLMDCNSNAFGIMGYVRKAMKREGKPPEEIEAYTHEATTGDYDHLVRVSQRKIDELNK